MHVVLTVDPEIPVPPKHYGGIERIVDMLVRGLIAKGHQITLFAHPDSTAPCQVMGWEGRSSSSRVATWLNMRQLVRFLRRADPARTVVHSFARLAYLLPVLPRPLAKVQSYQRPVTPRSVRWGDRLSRGTLTFTACSRWCAGTANGAGRWEVIYNGVPTERYNFVGSVPQNAPLVFLGRLERIKGPHHAITVARKTGRKLLIAGNVPTGGVEYEYCQHEVLAHCDGKQIEYIGPVDDRQKNHLLGQAAALLFPIEWDEPFGIVMTEALACGTPVLAFPRGAVPEVVEHGVNGFLCTDTTDMAECVARLPLISRDSCRGAAERRFSDAVIVGEYERLYRQLLTVLALQIKA